MTANKIIKDKIKSVINEMWKYRKGDCKEIGLDKKKEIYAQTNLAEHTNDPIEDIIWELGFLHGLGWAIGEKS